jgi:hypothetical protein
MLHAPRLFSMTIVRGFGHPLIVTNPCRSLPGPLP